MINLYILLPKKNLNAMLKYLSPCIFVVSFSKSIFYESMFFRYIFKTDNFAIMETIVYTLFQVVFIEKYLLDFELDAYNITLITYFFVFAQFSL